LLSLRYGLFRLSNQFFLCASSKFYLVHRLTDRLPRSITSSEVNGKDLEDEMTMTTKVVLILIIKCVTCIFMYLFYRSYTS